MGDTSTCADAARSHLSMDAMRFDTLARILARSSRRQSLRLVSGLGLTPLLGHGEMTAKRKKKKKHKQQPGAVPPPLPPTSPPPGPPAPPPPPTGCAPETPNVCASDNS